MNSVYISSLSEYIGTIEKLKSYYPRGVFNNPIRDQFLYRGQCDKQYELLPAIFRKQTDKEYGRVLRNFKYLEYVSSGIDLLQEFIHEASGLLKIPPNDLVHWAEYAQHYGVPTRFMDWSSNPLVALYFACRDEKTKDGTVWLLHKGNYEDFLDQHIEEQEAEREKSDIILDLIKEEPAIEYPILYTPYYVDARMSAQGSYFMVWGTRQEPLERMLSAENLQMILSETGEGERGYGRHEAEALLFRFDIHAYRKQPLLYELDIVGINEKTLFPGLDGIGRYVERKYRFDYNTAIEYF